MRKMIGRTQGSHLNSEYRAKSYRVIRCEFETSAVATACHHLAMLQTRETMGWAAAGRLNSKSYAENMSNLLSWLNYGQNVAPHNCVQRAGSQRARDADASASYLAIPPHKVRTWNV